MGLRKEGREGELTRIHVAALVAIREGSHARADESMQEQLGEDEDGGEEELPELDRLNRLERAMSMSDPRLECQ